VPVTQCVLRRGSAGGFFVLWQAEPEVVVAGALKRSEPVENDRFRLRHREILAPAARGAVKLKRVPDQSPPRVASSRALRGQRAGIEP
jgi:hypothetical protein